MYTYIQDCSVFIFPTWNSSKSYFMPGQASNSSPFFPGPVLEFSSLHPATILSLESPLNQIPTEKPTF